MVNYIPTVHKNLDLISSGRKVGIKKRGGRDAYNLTSSKGLLMMKGL